MSFQMSLGLTVNATSLPESGDGHSPSGLQDGQTIAPCLQVAPPVNLSARRAKEEGLLTSGTYGQRSFGSSASVALRQSLVSKLHQRMDSDGGILFRLTWKERVTPAGQTIYALRASGLSTSGNAFTGWQTPTVQDAGRKGSLEDYRKYVQDGQTSGCRLRAQVHTTGLAPWPTPNVPNGGRSPQDGKVSSTGQSENGKRQVDLQMAARLTPWPTPNAGPQNDGDSTWKQRRELMKLKHGNGNGFGMNLGQCATLAPWPTPKVQNANAPGEHGNGGQDLQTVAHGTTPSGSPAPTEKRGQLNAAFSRWLQGYPVEWDIAAILAHRQRKTRQKGG